MDKKTIENQLKPDKWIIICSCLFVSVLIVVISLWLDGGFVHKSVLFRLVKWNIIFWVYMTINSNITWWRRTLRVLGFPKPWLMFRMLKLRSRRSGSFGMLIIYLCILVFILLFHSILPTWFSICLVIYCIIFIFDLMMPPVVLLLGVSRSEVLSLQAEMWKAIGNMKVVSLLDFHKSENRYVRWAVNTFVFRATNGSKWYESMKELVDLVPFVVVDVRWQSEAVLKEITWLLSPRYVNKTFFVKGADGNRAALDSVLKSTKLQPPPNDHILTSDILLETLAKKYVFYGNYTKHTELTEVQRISMIRIVRIACALIGAIVFWCISRESSSPQIHGLSFQYLSAFLGALIGFYSYKLIFGAAGILSALFLVSKALNISDEAARLRSIQIFKTASVLTILSAILCIYLLLCKL